MDKTLKIIQKVLSIILAILVFFTWFKYKISVGGDADIMTISGMSTLAADIAPIALIILMFYSGDEIKISTYYLYASFGGFVITILTGIFTPIYYTAGKVKGVSEKVTWSYGIWISLVLYLALIVVSILCFPRDETGTNAGNNAIYTFAHKIQSLIFSKKTPNNQSSNTNVNSNNNAEPNTVTNNSEAAKDNSIITNNEVAKNDKTSNYKEEIKNDEIVNTNETAKSTNVVTTTAPSQINDTSTPDIGTTKMEKSTEDVSTTRRQFCIYCGSKLKDGASFCIKCGKKVGE